MRKREDGRSDPARGVTFCVESFGDHYYKVKGSELVCDRCGDTAQISEDLKEDLNLERDLEETTAGISE